MDRGRNGDNDERAVTETDANAHRSVEDRIKGFIQTSMPLRKTTKRNKVKLRPNTVFGTICFQGFGQKTFTDAPYVKVNAIPGDNPDYTEIASNAWTLMLEHWKVPEPKLIISVTGGAKSFEMSNRLRNSFKHGLVKAAISSDAWIVTGGTKTGVMEIVGEAVNEYLLQAGSLKQRIVLLGITTWGIIAGRAGLEDKNGVGCFPCYYNYQNIMKTSKDDNAPLDPNHSHFILVDDDTKNKYGGEIGFRTAFEQNRSNDVTPVVLLMLEGGKNTIKTAVEAIEKNTPIVIIEGSGRAADFIAAAARLKSSTFKRLDDPEMAGQWEKVWKCWKPPLPPQADKDTMIKDVILLLDPKYEGLLTVIKQKDDDSGGDIDKAIISALIKANDSNVKTQLRLALAWNRCDIAKQEIFSSARMKWKDLDLNDALYTALIEDKDEFVNLFIDCGVDIKKFLTIRRLYGLYGDVLWGNSTASSVYLLLNLVRAVQRSDSMWCCSPDSSSDSYPRDLLKIIGEVINNLSQDQSESLYTDQKYEVDNKRNADYFDDCVSDNGAALHDVNILPKKKSIADTTTPSAGDNDSPELANDFEYPERELFLWALLLNRKKLAKLFLKQGIDHISSALMASTLTTALAGKAEGEEELDLAIDLNKNAQEYQTLAVGVLNECYQRDKEKSHDLLIRDLNQWGNKTLFVLADTGVQMDFMEHTCCQTKLNQNWRGQMALYTPMWKILVGLLLPFFALPLIKFNDDSSDTNEVAPQRAGDMGGTEGRLGRKSKRNLRRVNFFKSIYLYHTAPVVKFCYYTISYLVFLGLFSYFMLINLYPYTPSVVEVIVWVWVVTMWIEEVRQLITAEPKTFAKKLEAYFTSAWNLFDQVVDLLFVISVILRLTLPEDTFVWARMMYSITLSLFYIRFLQFFFVEKNIGPKVVMIRQMVIDLLFFLLILAVFLLAYGIAQQTLLYPNSAPSWDVLYNVLYEPYFSIYGDFNLQEIEGNVPGCSDNSSIYSNAINADIPRCPETNWLVMILFSIYLLLTNILLINLLIAMFSYTFNNVQDNSEQVWRFYRYDLIKEYFEKPTLAPPLIIISHLWRIFSGLFKQCKDAKVKDDFRRDCSKEENRRFAEFERACMYNYFLTEKSSLTGSEALDYKLVDTGKKVEKMMTDVEYLKENLISIASSNAARQVPTLMSSPSTIALDSDEHMHTRLDELREQIDTILALLQKTESEHLSSTTSSVPNDVPLETLRKVRIRDVDYGTVDV